MTIVLSAAYLLSRPCQRISNHFCLTPAYILRESVHLTRMDSLATSRARPVTVAVSARGFHCKKTSIVHIGEGNRDKDWIPCYKKKHRKRNDFNGCSWIFLTFHHLKYKGTEIGNDLNIINSYCLILHMRKLFVWWIKNASSHQYKLSGHRDERYSFERRQLPPGNIASIPHS